MDSRYDDKLERNDDRDIDIKDVVETYKISLDYYGKAGSSKEFDEKVENMGALLRQKGIIIEREGLSIDDKEKTIDKEEMKIQIELQEKISQGVNLDTLPKDFDSYWAILSTTVEKDGERYLVRDIFEEKGIDCDFKFRLTKDDNPINMNVSLSDIIGKDYSISPLSREEYIEKNCDVNELVRDNFFKEFSSAKHVSLERTKDESFTDKLSALYDAKGLANSTLHYALSHVDSVKDIYEMRYNDATAFQAVSSFILSLSSDEKRFLLPQTKEESQNLTGEYYSGIIKDEILRPITGYANLNSEMIDRMSELLDGKKCLEVMAGNGLLSRELQDRGIDVVATDKYFSAESGYYALRGVDTHTEVERLDAVDAVEKYGGSVDVVIMSWPPYNHNIASDVIEALYEVNPDVSILYLGEPEGGCTANDLFFDEVRWDNYDDELNELHVCYEGIHDEIVFMKINEDFFN